MKKGDPGAEEPQDTTCKLNIVHTNTNSLPRDDSGYQLQDLKDAIKLRYIDLNELSPEEGSLSPIIEAEIKQMEAEFNERVKTEWAKE